MLAKFFIERPVLANVIALLTMLLGFVAIFTLPVSQYPPITPPTVQVTTRYPGANARTLINTVALPIEQQVNGVQDMIYMQSTSTNDGNYTLTVTFKVGTDLDFAGSGLDTGSGTLQLRASVPNAGFTLLPGLFARVRIALAAPVPRLVVPDRVVSSDQVGSYLLTVGPDQKVRQQRIETGPLESGFRAVLAGLDANSEVVIDGLQNAIPGNLVTATERPLTPPAYQAASTP